MAALVLPRRVFSLLWFLILVAVAFFFFSYGEEAWSALPRPLRDGHFPFTSDDGLHADESGGGASSPASIWILESIGTHDEVAAALVHSFGGMRGGSELRTFFRHQRYEMGSIMDKFELEAPVVEQLNSDRFASAISNMDLPDVLVVTTCELDLDAGAANFRKLLARENATTYMFCVMHHADRWVEGKHVNVVREWIEQDRAEFIGLSQHTVDFLLNTTVPKWDDKIQEKLEVRARALPPVFPVDTPEPKPEDGISLAMQGDFSTGRRDYKGIFAQLDGVITRVRNMTEGGGGGGGGGADGQDQREPVTLHVIGHGNKPDVPEKVRDHVVFDEGLSYPDFYSLLGKSYSIIPAFASDTYLDRKASSTVPASLIAGAPMVADEQILRAYTYLPREAVWVAQEGEGEMDTIQRVVEDRDEYARKRQAVREAADRIMEDNRRNVAGWIAEARQRVLSTR